MTTRTGTDPWVRLARITAVIGLSSCSFVLLFGTIIPLAAVGEPPFTASNDEARAYFANVSVGWPQLALSRFFWTSEIWLLPYLLFWLWVIIVCVRLLRWSPSVSAVPAPASKP